jgi:hydroxypyruvate isomerase
MPRFAANLTMLFTERPFLERFDAAAAAGFEAVEFLFPYDFAAADIAAALKKNKLTLVLHNLPAGDWAKGERGIACHPDRVAEFRAGVPKAIEYAKFLGCPQVNCLAGIKPSDVSDADAMETLVANLTFAATELDKVGIRLVIEAINTRDIPGFFVSSTKQALVIMDAVGSANLKFQYDIYHMQIMEGDVARTMETHLDRIGHIQLADNPGRNEPGTGELNYPFLFAHLDRIGYAGSIGCEYKPKAGTEAGLGWFAATKATPAKAA